MQYPAVVFNRKDDNDGVDVLTDVQQTALNSKIVPNDKTTATEKTSESS